MFNIEKVTSRGGALTIPSVLIHFVDEFKMIIYTYMKKKNCDLTIFKIFSWIRSWSDYNVRHGFFFFNFHAYLKIYNCYE